MANESVILLAYVYQPMTAVAITYYNQLKEKKPLININIVSASNGKMCNINMCGVCINNQWRINDVISKAKAYPAMAGPIKSVA